MAEQFVRLGEYGTTEEAGAVVAALSAGGIRAVMDSGAANSWLWHMSPALGGVLVFVPESQLERAESLLDLSAPSDRPLSPWRCSECSETSPGGFLVCWKCGHEFAQGIDQSLPPTDPPPVAEEAPADALVSSLGWQCSVCGEKSPESFSVCWKCGHEFVESSDQRCEIPIEEGPKAENGIGVTLANDSQEALRVCSACGGSTTANLETCQLCGAERGGEPNPYHATARDSQSVRQPQVSHAAALEKRPPPAEQAEPPEEMLQRAYRAALIGCVTLPVALHLYSVFVLIGAGLNWPRTIKNWYYFGVAAAIDVGVFLVLSALIFG